MRRARLYLAHRMTLLSACLLFLTLSHGSTVRPIDLEEMTARAATIFAGRCTHVEVVEDAELGLPVTVVKFAVDRRVKGEGGSIHTLRLIGGGGELGDATNRYVPGLPSFAVGEEVVLFLYGESRIGLSSPVGLGQGKFEVLRDKNGRRYAVNGDGNSFLLRGVAPGIREQLRPPGSTSAVLDPDLLLDVAQELAEVAP